MKIKLTLIFVLLWGLTMSAQQELSVITGNVAIPNVNIQVLNTQHGTSSDKNGDFSLKVIKTDFPIGLLFTCVGYLDTLVSVVPQHIVPQRIILDCFNNCQIVGQDSVYQIVKSNEIDVKTGKTIPCVNANSNISNKLIIYKGNLYSLKKRRDSGNSEVSLIEKTKLN